MKLHLLIGIIYTLLLLSLLPWGIPNKDRLYPYQMDEWHQLQAVKAVFTQGTPNVPGSAHGPMFYFLLSGLYLAPFSLLGIINPLNVESLARIFILLRLNTLLFGLGSAFILVKIAKKYFKVSPALALFLFLFTPIWLSLSNYFKYDIALIFWILLFFFFLLRFGQKGDFKSYILGGVAGGLALATKISALPLIPIYIIAYFFFKPKKERQLKEIFLGNLIFLVVFLALGVPYFFYRGSGLTDFLKSNLISVPNESGNFILGLNPWIFLFSKQYPSLFGHELSFLFLISLVFFIFQARKLSRNLIFILISFLIFFLSLLPLKLFVSNRALVLAPFMALLVAAFIKQCRPKSVLIIFFIIILGLQSCESFSWLLVKIGQDPRRETSAWLESNLAPGTTIGIENIPIYQMLPDIIVKEYYGSGKKRFNYQIIEKESILPSLIILSNSSIAVDFQKSSAKKDLVKRLAEENYKVIASFTPKKQWLNFFTDDLNFFLTSNIIPSSEIVIYQKKSL